ncbi:4-hydroxy-3-methylbut-2-enyl diphosphate reductase [Candidatus Hepatincolaceae symbiont of Richtersius coronifer]
MKNLEIILINPRGFCAGVSRAVDIVDQALKLYGKPIYVRHEIVHNKIIVEEFKNKGVIFVKEISEIPIGATAIFSAHGVAKAVEDSAKESQLNYIDATCPLVSKVHKEGIKYFDQGYQVILIGHNHHPEVVGIAGRIPGKIFIISNEEEARSLQLNQNKPIAYITQTTLSLDDTANIIEILKERFPNITGPDSKNICYATQNRQTAIKNIINEVDALIVVGSKNSSNSTRLKEIGDKNHKLAFLINNKQELDYEALSSCNKIALSAGASAPEAMVQEILQEMALHRHITLTNYQHVEENVIFALPKSLRNALADLQINTPKP